MKRNECNILWISTKKIFLDHLFCWAIFLSTFNSSAFRSISFFLVFFYNLCGSWRRSRSHKRKGNRQLAYANGKMQIADLLFSCASWISFKRHKESLMEKRLMDKTLEEIPEPVANKEKSHIVEGPQKW